MFTGIIRQLGTVAALSRRRRGARAAIRVSSDFAATLKPGDSIAVSGCCLTVAALDPPTGRRGQACFFADLSAQTLARTNLGQWRPGVPVNLEPALRLGEPLGGHFVQGHVEGVGTLLAMQGDRHSGWTMSVRVPPALLRYLMPQGSLTVNGVSLTVAAIENDVARFAIIPYTYTHTDLGRIQPGALLNLETDPLARHVERLLAYRANRRWTVGDFIGHGF